MQRAYISKLMELAEQDSRVLHLVADSGTGFDEMFKRNFPNQMMNFGIAEEHMIAAAAGLASGGKIPFVFTADAFLAYRGMEFIRDDICFQNQNVKIVGMGCGLSWSTLGPSHHTTEAIGVLRSIPNLVVLTPATPKQVAECVRAAYEYEGPVYIRIGMNNEPEFFGDDYRFVIGKCDVMREGGTITVFSTGSILSEAMKAVDLLEADGAKCNLVDMTSLKPIDVDRILSMASGSACIITVEEHNVYGGLGSIVADVLADAGIAKKLIRVGIRDGFAKGYGTLEQVRKTNGLLGEQIYAYIKEHMA